MWFKMTKIMWDNGEIIDTDYKFIYQLCGFLFMIGIIIIALYLSFGGGNIMILSKLGFNTSEMKSYTYNDTENFAYSHGMIYNNCNNYNNQPCYNESLTIIGKNIEIEGGGFSSWSRYAIAVKEDEYTRYTDSLSLYTNLELNKSYNLIELDRIHMGYLSHKIFIIGVI
jgi:hypothetical protein